MTNASFQLPDEIAKAVQDRLRPSAKPASLRVELVSDQTHGPSSASAPAASTFPDELDVAVLLWHTQLAFEANCDFPPDTVVIRLAVPKRFESLWTSTSASPGLEC
jgi:hypothetical protein